MNQLHHEELLETICSLANEIRRLGGGNGTSPNGEGVIELGNMHIVNALEQINGSLTEIVSNLADINANINQGVNRNARD